MLYCLKILFLTELLCSNVLLEQSEKNPFLLNQNDYKLNFERAEFSSYNKEYLEDAKIKTFKYNRTCTAFNASSTFKVSMENEVEVIFQAFKFASNEYRLFPLRFQVNFCDMMSIHILGINLYGKCGNSAVCPIKKGNKYAICNFTPDTSKFPPFIPSGRYMFEVQLLYRSVVILTANGYAEVSRPFTGK